MIEDFEKHIAAGRKEYEPYLKALHDIRDAGRNVIINIPADLLQEYNKLRASVNLKPHKSEKLKVAKLNATP